MTTKAVALVAEHEALKAIKAAAAEFGFYVRVAQLDFNAQMDANRVLSAYDIYTVGRRKIATVARTIPGGTYVMSEAPGATLGERSVLRGLRVHARLYGHPTIYVER